MNKFQTLYELMWFANAKKSFTAQEVADHFHISLRSAYRYLTNLGDLGFYLYSEKGRNGGFQTLENQLLPPILFTNDEVFSILFAFQSIHYFKDFPFKIDVASTSEKLINAVSPSTRKKMDRLNSIFRITNPYQPVESPLLNQVIEASIDQKVITFEYHAIQKKSNKKVAPIGVYSNNGFWYLMAMDVDINEKRNYRIDRMYNLTISDVIHPVDDSIDSLEKPHPIKKPHPLYVTLTADGVRQCQESRYFINDIHIKKDGSGVLDAIIDEHDIPFTASYFLQLGSLAHVKQPQAMLDYLDKKLKELNQLYLK